MVKGFVMKRTNRDKVLVLLSSMVVLFYSRHTVLALSKSPADILDTKRIQVIDAINLLQGDKGGAFDAVDSLYDVAKKSCQVVESVGTEGAKLAQINDQQEASLRNATDENIKLKAEINVLQKQLVESEESNLHYKEQIERLKKDQKESLAATEELKKQVDSILAAEQVSQPLAAPDGKAVASMSN